MDPSRPFHTNCAFTGRVLCRCLYGTSVQLQDGAAATEYMQLARAAWRLLQHPSSSAAGSIASSEGSSGLDGQEAVVLMLPKLVKQAPPAYGTNGSIHSAAGQVAAVAARLEQAEAAARAAALRAATLAAASGLPYRPPDGVPVDVNRITKVDHSDLERQVAVVHRVQEARQAAAAAAAAAAAQQSLSLPLSVLQAAGPSAGGAEPPPVVVPLSALVAGSAGTADDVSQPSGATPSDQLPPSSGRPVRRTRSLEPPVPGGPAGLQAANSLPPAVPSSSSGGRGPKRSPAGRPRARGAAGAGGKGGPGKGARGKAAAAAKQQQQQQEGGHAVSGEQASGLRDPPGAGAGAGGAAHQNGVDLTPFGDGYEPRGSSTATPPKSWLLKFKDFKPSLQGRLVQTFWSDGAQWWPAVVLTVSVAERTCSLYYETGDEETVEFTQLIQAGEVAWLNGPQAAARSGSADGSSRRRQQPSGMQSPSLQSNRTIEQQQGGGEGGRPGPPTARGKRQRTAAGAMSPHSHSPASAQPTAAGVPAPPTWAGNGAGAGAGGAATATATATGAAATGNGAASTSAGALREPSGSSDQLIAGGGMGGTGAGTSTGGGHTLTWRSESTDGGLSLQPSPPRLQQAAPGGNAAEPGSGAGLMMGLHPAAQLPLTASLPGGLRLTAARGSEQLLVDTSAATVLPLHPMHLDMQQGAAAALQAAQQAAAAQQVGRAGSPLQPSLMLQAELPSYLRTAAAELPAGAQLARIWDLLALEEQAVGRHLLVCTLGSNGWQPALVRQCSAKHGLVQVQFNEQQGVLLQAAEEGKTFLLAA